MGANTSPTSSIIATITAVSIVTTLRPAWEQEDRDLDEFFPWSPLALPVLPDFVSGASPWEAAYKPLYFL